MARTLEALQRQLATLQQKVDAAKAREAIGVIERIQQAIEFYGLTADDLFGSTPKMGPSSKADGVKPKVGRPAKPDGAKAKMGRAPKVAGANTSATKKAALPPKYQDEAGNAWSGHGKRPNWFKAAIENGKTAEDLLVKPEQ
jgi:DNA-binding protein H-NS